MIENVELPVGFAFELAKHSDIMAQFAGLSKEKRNSIVTSKNEMRQYVENMFREPVQ